MAERHLKLVRDEGEPLPAVEPEHRIKMQFGDRTVFLTSDNTIFRAFVAGGGTYDHWIFWGDEEDCSDSIAFIPSPGLHALLLSLECDFHRDAKPDEATLEFIGNIHATGAEQSPARIALRLVKPPSPDMLPPDAA